MMWEYLEFGYCQAYACMLQNLAQAFVMLLLLLRLGS
jgi:hypothetical protein